MSYVERALCVTFNSGVETVAPTNRSLAVSENIGVEIHPVEARALAAAENIGIEVLEVLARALYDPLAVTENNGEDNGAEIQLVGTDLITIEKILRGK